jgi:hypothetical protein
MEYVFSDTYDSNRNLNAAVRFVVYWTILIFVMTRQWLIFVLLVVLLVIMRQGHPGSPVLDHKEPGNDRTFCQLPSASNPLANPTPGDWGNGSGKLPACPGETVKDAIADAMGSQPITGAIYNGSEVSDANSKLAARTFYSVPTSGVPDGRQDFINGLYGGNLARSV